MTAMDDGECCSENRDPAEPSKVHTSTAVVVVFITDVNDNKPVFEDCSSYTPKIEEGAPNGSPVIHVHAVDKDKGRISMDIFKENLAESRLLIMEHNYPSPPFFLIFVYFYPFLG